MTRLFVADDAPFIREIVRAVAERIGGLTLIGEATDGEEAVDLALKLRPDVILMDLIMPKKSGVEAAREIIRVIPDARIVAFSTADQETMVMRALEAGCCSYMEKPFTQDQLANAIHDALKK